MALVRPQNKTENIKLLHTYTVRATYGRTSTLIFTLRPSTAQAGPYGVGFQGKLESEFVLRSILTHRRITKYKTAQNPVLSCSRLLRWRIRFTELF